MMDYKTFQKQSMRTMPFGGKNFNFVEFHNILSNYTLGTLGEWHELQVEVNKVNIVEGPHEILLDSITNEIGDTMHYLMGTLTILGEEFDYSRLEELVTYESIEGDLSNIAEIVKKHTYHGHDLEKEKLINSIYRLISHLNTHFKHTMESILDKNIEKLKKRYPEKFTVEDSIARVDTK